MAEFKFSDAMAMRDKPDKPKLKLVGTDGNAFAIMGKAHQALRHAGRFGYRLASQNLI